MIILQIISLFHLTFLSRSQDLSVHDRGPAIVRTDKDDFDGCETGH